VTVQPELELPRAGWSDAEALTRVIADAFHGLPPSIWLIGDPDERRDVFGPYFQIFVEMALANGIVFTSPERTAAALWLPVQPGHGEPGGGEPGGGEPGGGYGDRLAAAVGPRYIERFRTFDRLLADRYPTRAAHYHLTMVAVAPHMQRRGIGTALLTGSHRFLDSENSPAYLEAADAGTRSLYLRHGYADLGDPIQLPDGPRMYPMWRPVGGS
jgi:GNAT superfamily N-acetyltransferase